MENPKDIPGNAEDNEEEESIKEYCTAHSVENIETAQ